MSATVSDSDILPCPFCGEAHDVVVRSVSDVPMDDPAGGILDIPVVTCIPCDAYGPIPRVASRSKAIELWNERTK